MQCLHQSARCEVLNPQASSTIARPKTSLLEWTTTRNWRVNLQNCTNFELADCNAATFLLHGPISNPFTEDQRSKGTLLIGQLVSLMTPEVSEAFCKPVCLTALQLKLPSGSIYVTSLRAKACASCCQLATWKTLHHARYCLDPHSMLAIGIPSLMTLTHQFVARGDKSLSSLASMRWCNSQA